MDKGLQEVISKLNQMNQVSPQTSKPIEIPKVEEKEEEVDDDFLEDTEEKKEAPQPTAKVENEIELLHNDGRFRLELLFQLQELNKALSVIAQILMKK